MMPGAAQASHFVKEAFARPGISKLGILRLRVRSRSHESEATKRAIDDDACDSPIRESIRKGIRKSIRKSMEIH